MKWFKHSSTASQNAKIQKLTYKYKSEGYAVYFYCLELISNELDEHNVSFRLEHDCQLIARNLGFESQDRVVEIIKYIVELGLFQIDNAGYVICLGLASRLDETQSKNKHVKNMIENMNSKWESFRVEDKTHRPFLDLEPTVTEVKRNDSVTAQEQIGNDSGITPEPVKKPKKDPSEGKIPFEDVWALYDKKSGDKKKLARKWYSLKKEQQQQAMQHIPNYVLATPDKQYRKNFQTYLNQEAWEDEVIVSRANKSTDMSKTIEDGWANS